MLKINDSINRDLSKICDAHLKEIEPFIMQKVNHKGRLSKRQNEFIRNNIKEIIIEKPKRLHEINEEFISYCTENGAGKIKKPNSKISSVIDYNYFSNKEKPGYNAYSLANALNFRSCPYCNRNYTVTISNDKKRIVRPDFDHFFPKKTYPLLALSFYNLIPSCLICNRTTKNQQPVEYGKYLHPYEEGFGSALKFNYLSIDTDSSLGLGTNMTVLFSINPLETTKAQKCLENVALFKLDEIYRDSHNGEVADIIRKYYISGGNYLETLKNSFPDIGEIDELYRLAFGNYYSEGDFEKRPLSKLTKDIVEQLGFTYSLTKKDLLIGK